MILHHQSLFRSTRLPRHGNRLKNPNYINQEGSFVFQLSRRSIDKFEKFDDVYARQTNCSGSRAGSIKKLQLLLSYMLSRNHNTILTVNYTSNEMQYTEIVKSVSDLTIIMSQKNSKKYIYIFV